MTSESDLKGSYSHSMRLCFNSRQLIAIDFHCVFNVLEFFMYQYWALFSSLC